MMPTLLFRLHGVDAEEAQEVRQVLQDNAVETIETSAGWWGTGVAAIWLVDDQDAARARALLDHYQEQRVRDARRRSDLGLNDSDGSFWRRLVEQPAQVVSTIVAALLILALSIWPFVTMLDR